MLNREELLLKLKPPVLAVDVPALGGEVGVKRLTAQEVVDLRAMMPDRPDEPSIETTDDEFDHHEARLLPPDLDAPPKPLTPEQSKQNLEVTAGFLAMVLCDADGNRLFSADELKAFDNEGFQSLAGVLEAAQKHNRLDKESREDLRKNSESGQTSGST